VRPLLLTLLAGLAVACAHPSRRLPVRAIDDPITMPAQLLELTLGATGSRADQDAESAAGPIVGWRYGITDRLTWQGLGMFEYALLDDAPPESAATGARAVLAPVGLMLSAGLMGFGYSSTEGTLVYPSVGMSVIRHLAGRLTLGGGASWIGGFSDLKHQSRTQLRVEAQFQALTRLVLQLSVFDWFEWRGGSPGDWREHTAGTALGVEYRPVTWMDLGAAVRGEAWWWRARPMPPAPTEPGPLPAPLPTERAPVLWASAWAAFRW
jgi:hypothetical protein